MKLEGPEEIFDMATPNKRHRARPEPHASRPAIWPRWVPFLLGWFFHHVVDLGGVVFDGLKEYVRRLFS